MSYADHADVDVYSTDRASRTWLAWLAKLRPLARLAFYIPVWEIVYRHGRIAAAGKFDDQTWFGSANEILRTAEAVGMDVRIEGLHNLRGISERPAVIVGNHMSTLETFLLPRFVLPHGRVTYVVKESLLTYPVFGHVMRSRDPIAVGRTNPREDLKAVLEGGEERLKRGLSIIVFPQTTRTPRFDPEQFNTIGAKLAGRAGVPLIPMALRTDAWGNGKKLKDFGPVNVKIPVRLRFGEPLFPDRRGAEAHQKTVEFIQRSLDEWYAEYPPQF